MNIWFTSDTHFGHTNIAGPSISVWKDGYRNFNSVQDVFTGKIGKREFHLSHYSHQVWPASHKGVIHLFGHSHGSLKGIGRSMDVGVDTHKEFRPYHINEIFKIMDKIPVKFIDHHELDTNR